MPNVNVIGGDQRISAMFQEEGWKVVDLAADADLLQFPGGRDVSPSLYRHTKHSKTYPDPRRDKVWQMIFNMAVAAGKPMVGICGGGQFLNVMCGGSMIQDIDGHATGKGHVAKDERTGELIYVTSTHHQMMVPHKTNAEVIMTAKESKWAEKHIDNKVIGFSTMKARDIEALWYAEQKCFCFQPHPEYAHEGGALRRMYFDYIWEFFHIGSNRIITPDMVRSGQPIVRVVPGL
jgi:gamma-glutamyl-gamma-aminobutyrate hydrolase PuuD